MLIGVFRGQENGSKARFGGVKRHHLFEPKRVAVVRPRGDVILCGVDFDYDAAAVQGDAVGRRLKGWVVRRRNSTVVTGEQPSFLRTQLSPKSTGNL